MGCRLLTRSVLVTKADVRPRDDRQEDVAVFQGCFDDAGPGSQVMVSTAVDALPAESVAASNRRGSSMGSHVSRGACTVSVRSGVGCRCRHLDRPMGVGAAAFLLVALAFERSGGPSTQVWAVTVLWAGGAGLATLLTRGFSALNEHEPEVAEPLFAQFHEGVVVLGFAGLALSVFTMVVARVRRQHTPRWVAASALLGGLVWSASLPLAADADAGPIEPVWALDSPSAGFLVEGCVDPIPIAPFVLEVAPSVIRLNGKVVAMPCDLQRRLQEGVARLQEMQADLGLQSPINEINVIALPHVPVPTEWLATAARMGITRVNMASNVEKRHRSHSRGMVVSTGTCAISLELSPSGEDPNQFATWKSLAEARSQRPFALAVSPADGACSP